MKWKTIIVVMLAVLLPLGGHAQSVEPTATYIDEDQNTVEATTDFTEQAPLDVMFRANPQNMGNHTPAYEWHFRKEGEAQDMMVRYEEDTQYTFTESGTFKVTLKTSLTDIDQELDSVVIRITISESKLDFPNAFSPNGDGINDVYRAKPGYRSIVQFHAYIFNRWGQKLYEWTDPAGGWDGTYKGSDVKQGTYYVLVKAKGADGREYNIKRDVNLLRGYIEGTSTTPTE